MDKNILILNYEFPPVGGGAGRVSYEIAQNCINQGYKPDIVTMKFKKLPSKENLQGITIYRVKSLRKKINISHRREQLTYIISAFFKSAILLKRKSYVGSYCFFLIPTGIVSLFLKKLFGLKYIVLARGSDVPGYNPDRFTIIHRFTPRILRKIINNSDAIIANSEYLKSLIEKNIKGINKKINVIHNGVDVDEIKPGKKEKIILGTGRLWPLKGFDLLLQAFSNIKDVKGYELHICGDGPMMKELKEIQQKSKNKIILHGWIDNKSDEYKKLLESAMILCHPSISDSSPNSLIEGLSAGCTIITTNIGGCKEIGEDVGFLVDSSIESIEKTLELLLNDEKKLEIYGKKSRDMALKKFDMNKMFNEYLKIFQETIEN